MADRTVKPKRSLMVVMTVSFKDPKTNIVRKESFNVSADDYPKEEERYEAAGYTVSCENLNH